MHKCSKDTGALKVKFAMIKLNASLRLVCSKIVWAALPPVAVGRAMCLDGLCKFMASTLFNVLREGWLSGLGYAELISDHYKSMIWHCCGYTEGALDPDLISFPNRVFSGCLSKCLWYRQVGLYSKRVLLPCLWDHWVSNGWLPLVL